MMSFALTERQLMDGTKTVTRRTGWQTLKRGDRLLAVRKAMGLKPGEKIQPLCEIEILAVDRVHLFDITPQDVVDEGFPEWFDRPQEFVEMFCKAMRVKSTDEVTRIEFRKVPGTERVAVQQGLTLT